MRSTSFSLILLLLSGALAAVACDDNEPDGSATAGRGGTSNGGHGGGGSSGKGGHAGASAGASGSADAAGAAGTGVAGQAGGAEAGNAGTAGASGEPDLHLYVGCSVAEGTLQSYRVSNGTFTPLPVTSTGGSISNATFNQAEDLLYVAHAVGAGPAGRITTYSRNTTSGTLTPIGTPADVPFTTPSFAGSGGSGGVAGSGGSGGVAGLAGSSGSGGAPATNPLPQTLTLDASEGHIAVPNYGSGNVYVYNLLPNGSLGAIVSADDGGLNAHHAVFSNNHDFMLVPYLGSNQIKVYAYQQSTGKITLDSTVTMPAATSKPRHLALHANGTWLYAINEMTGDTASATGSVDLFSFNQTSGDLTPVQTYPIPLPSGYTGLKNGSEIAIAPSGKFLYVSMRLDGVTAGSLVVYRIDDNGGLTFVEQQSSRGLTPRQFSLSKDGKQLIVGNQNSAKIELFSVDTESGALSFVAEQDVCSSPRFARFAEIR